MTLSLNTSFVSIVDGGLTLLLRAVGFFLSAMGACFEAGIVVGMLLRLTTSGKTEHKWKVGVFSVGPTDKS